METVRPGRPVRSVRSSGPSGPAGGAAPVAVDPRLAGALERSGLALLLLDAEGAVVHATRGLTRALGLGPQEVLGQRRLTWWLGLSVVAPLPGQGDPAGGEPAGGRSRLDPVQGAALRAAAPAGVDLLRAVRAGDVDVEVDVARSDGQLLVAHVQVTTDDGDGAVLVLRDITSERAAQQQLRTLLARQEAVISASPDTIYRIHLGQQVVEWANTGPASLLGLPPGDGSTPAEPPHPDDAPGVRRALEALRTAGTGEIVECTYRVLDPFGGHRWIHTRSTVSDRSAAGVPVRVVGLAQDLTETITTMDALAGSERRFHEIFARGPVGMLLFGLEGWISEVNHALCTFWERDPSELVGAPAGEHLDPAAPAEDERPHAGDRDERARAEDQLQALLSGDAEVVHRERCYELPSGKVVWARISLSLTSSSSGEPAFLAFVEDVTARRREAEQLEHAALHDPLTGLPNRAKAEEQLRSALSRTVRRGGGCAVLFVDLDHFKDVNDTLGHAAGDALLIDVADRLRGLLRAGDLAARIGGDEFVLVCEDVGDAQALSSIAERVCERISIPVDLGVRTVTVSASIGAARTEGDLGPEELLRAADRAMYRAKAAGRACWRAA
ncbi:sensor domain-containing protein [Kineococcus radiotolerans]|uniref:Diguanylate cyclase with PAS/PAC sensor n=1 Tax=Kineococcus radiotolerans (strain ATCC BAA-149 / DSM 14245 / SRS30216) TaxID=266940 RepID=A6W8M5_KINRD|nr:sensor domain-containing diguanylate cyclase [Kineococcus radiotolerans]ABS03164.1 diguanylate cyclase with PAS/PAC sensor [Kineococcus radiotolerans SRS30216 = ATCC BAA-149]